MRISTLLTLIYRALHNLALQELQFTWTCHNAFFLLLLFYGGWLTLQMRHKLHCYCMTTFNSELLKVTSPLVTVDLMTKEFRCVLIRTALWCDVVHSPRISRMSNHLLYVLSTSWPQILCKHPLKNNWGTALWGKLLNIKLWNWLTHKNPET